MHIPRLPVSFVVYEKKEMLVVGNKNTFAIEYEVKDGAPFFMTESVLWIQGQPLGIESETGTLYALYRGLARLVSKKGNFYEEEFLNKSPEEIIYIMIPTLSKEGMTFHDLSPLEQERVCKYDKYMAHFGENYDKVTIRIFAVNGIYHFLWQGPEYSNQSLRFGSDLKHCTVSIDEIEKVISEFGKEYERLVNSVH